ncbi:MAG: nucleotidyltransferase family protein [Gammaproteobacteria bacterium]|nr:nucleotidyltransferase family protein [Gammaproteobacteria bacterium]
MRLAIVILAAGESRRLGEAKQLISINGKSLLQDRLEVIKKTVTNFDADYFNCELYCVLGSRNESIKKQINFSSVTLIDNGKWQEGIASSLRISVDFINESYKPDAIMYVTCDQWCLNRMDFQKLLSLWVENIKLNSNNIVAAEYETLGVPAIFDKKWFVYLRELTGDSGAKKILNRFKNDVTPCPLPNAKFDLDTKQDYLFAQKIYKAQMTELSYADAQDNSIQTPDSHRTTLGAIL